MKNSIRILFVTVFVDEKVNKLVENELNFLIDLRIEEMLCILLPSEKETSINFNCTDVIV